MHQKKSLAGAVIALAFLSLFWGYNWVVMKAVMHDVGPFDFSAMRTSIGAGVLFAALLWRRRSLKPVAVLPTLLLGLLQTAAFTALIQWALIDGGAGKVAMLAYTMPFWALLMAWVVLKERLRSLQWGAVAVAAVGLVAILEPWSQHASVSSNAKALTAGVVWAASAILAKRIRGSVKVDLLSLTAWQMLFGAIALILVACWVPSPPIRITGYFVGALAFNGVLCTGLAWLLWLYVLDTLPTGVASLASLAVPVIGFLSAWIELGERPSSAELTGMALIITALGLLGILGIQRGAPAPASLARSRPDTAPDAATGR